MRNSARKNGIINELSVAIESVDGDVFFVPAHIQLVLVRRGRSYSVGGSRFSLSEIFSCESALDCAWVLRALYGRVPYPSDIICNSLWRLHESSMSNVRGRLTSADSSRYHGWGTRGAEKLRIIKQIRV